MPKDSKMIGCKKVHVLWCLLGYNLAARVCPKTLRWSTTLAMKIHLVAISMPKDSKMMEYNNCNENTLSC